MLLFNIFHRNIRNKLKISLFELFRFENRNFGFDFNGISGSMVRIYRLDLEKREYS